MSEPEINGYLVVDRAPQGTMYAGPDRQPWKLVEDAFYANTLPPEFRQVYKRIRNDESRGLLWWPTAQSLEDAVPLLHWSRDAGGRVELLGVNSPYMSAIGSRKRWVEPKAAFIGLDVISVGEWSLLRELLSTPRLVEAAQLCGMNSRGLLDEQNNAVVVQTLYRDWEHAGEVEPFAPEGSGVIVECVEVYAIQV